MRGEGRWQLYIYYAWMHNWQPNAASVVSADIITVLVDSLHIHNCHCERQVVLCITLQYLLHVLILRVRVISAPPHVIECIRHEGGPPRDLDEHLHAQFEVSGISEQILVLLYASRGVLEPLEPLRVDMGGIELSSSGIVNDGPPVSVEEARLEACIVVLPDALTWCGIAV